MQRRSLLGPSFVMLVAVFLHLVLLVPFLVLLRVAADLPSAARWPSTVGRPAGW